MLRRLTLSALVAPIFALLFVLVLAFSASAQETGPTLDPGDDPLVLEPVTATVSQAVPLSLTLTLPGPDGGFQIIVLPVTLTLDISLTLSSDITATVLASAGPVTASVPTTIAVDLPATPEPETDTETSTEATAEETEGEATDEPVAEVTDETTGETTEEVTEAPTATPTPAPAQPTATPAAPADATPQPTATPTPDEQVVAAPSCPDPRSVISSPGVNQVVSGLFEVHGTAVHDEFQYYKLEYAVGGTDGAEYIFLDSSGTQVENGLLAVVNSANFTNGVFSLRLIVVDRTGNYPPPCEVTILIEN